MGGRAGWWTERVLPRVVDHALRAPEIDEQRVRVCARLAGRVLEVGFGSGLNLRHLPPAVTEVLAVEPSDLGWELSERRRDAATVPVRRVGLDGQHVDLPDAHADSALVTFSLCTIPDPALALSEVRRVLRPGGRVHVLEHGRGASEGVARWQHRLDPVQRRVAGGCHLSRDMAALVTESGFELETREDDVLGVSGPARVWATVSLLVGRRP